jgi:hypothetical protein
VAALLCVIPVAFTWIHLPYYLMTRAERLRSADHALLKPSAGLGLAFGVAGLTFFLFMWLYPIRRSVPWLAWTGSIGTWLRVHIVAGLVLPITVAVHAGWRFEGLIGLGYLSMLVVCASGVMGRYLYVRIPRDRSGLELSLDQVNGERRTLLTRIAAITGLDPRDVERALEIDPRPYAGLDPLRTLMRMVRDDLTRRRVLRHLRRVWATAGVARPLDPQGLRETLRLARREMSLHQQLRMLDATQRLFGYWHVAHRPFAVTALLAILIHVAVAVMIGGAGITQPGP